jgi:hypothetical protein
MVRTREDILNSINKLQNSAFTSHVNQGSRGKINSYNQLVTDLEDKVKLNEVIIVIQSFFNDKGVFMTSSEIEVMLKKAIEPIVFNWVQDNMPRIAKEVLIEIAEKNKLIKK